MLLIPSKKSDNSPGFPATMPAATRNLRISGDPSKKYDLAEQEAENTAGHLIQIGGKPKVKIKAAETEEASLNPTTSAFNHNRALPLGIHQQIQQTLGRGTPLEDKIKSFMESRFSTDLSAVRKDSDRMPLPSEMISISMQASINLTLNPAATYLHTS